MTKERRGEVKGVDVFLLWLLLFLLVAQDRGSCNATMG